ncbi:MAG: lytic transglycosylase domain-containing protein [Candidatus Eisenbacteria bacterium]
MAIRGVGLGLILSAALLPSLVNAAEVFESPSIGPGARVIWRPARDSVSSPPGPLVDSLAFWRAQVFAGPGLHAVGVSRVFAERLAAHGDTLAADSVLASTRLSTSVWAWRALRQRSELALAEPDTARALRMLDAADRGGWPDGDRAAWLSERARLAAATGDTVMAIAFARQVIQVYPSLGPAGASLQLLTTLLRSRGDSLGTSDERLAAEVDHFRAMRGSAAARLRRVLPRVELSARWRVALRLAEVLRESRMPVAARAAADTAFQLAPDPESRARAQLERARALRDGATTDSALGLYRRIARTAPEATIRATAWWEFAREAQDRSRWAEAYSGFVQVVGAGERRVEEARFLAGLMRFVQGDRDSARVWWRSGTSEAARFWYGVAMREVDRAAGDSILSVLARAPGYAFYRASARETLGVRGWTGRLAAEHCAADTACEVLDAVVSLRRIGLAEDAAFLLTRWAASDPRLVPAGRRADVGQWLLATRLAYAGGNLSAATRDAERAFAAAGDVDSLAWSVVPWAYPPPFESFVVAAESIGVERALLWALMRQESRFDPRARSRSDALGLAQLKRAAATDVAGWLREPDPTEERLFQPEVGVRYGARYLQHLLQRFEGHEAVALAAYNAGPGAIRRDWRLLLAKGGEALFCELASNADSQDYVRRIMGMRQAYRELRPTSAL